MDKKIQDLAWACLPKEARDRIKIAYKSDYVSDRGYLPTRGMEVLQNVFGFHNLTSDTEPTELLYAERNEVVRMYQAHNLVDTYGMDSNKNRTTRSVLKYLFGDKCLPDKTLEEKAKEIVDTIKEDIENPIQMPETMLYPQPSVQVEPKFKVGDKVIVKANAIDPSNHIGEIAEINYHFNPDIYKVKITPCGYYIIQVDDLEPYTEPISQNPAENCDSENLNSNSDNMEAKELNLCELLKGCEGERFYLLSRGYATLKKIIYNKESCDYSIVLAGKGQIELYATGKEINNEAIVILYPSKELYEKYPLDAKKAWMEWASERKPKYKLRVKVSLYENEEWREDKSSEMWMPINSPSDAQQATEAVRECLQKFHDQNAEE